MVGPGQKNRTIRIHANTDSGSTILLFYTHIVQHWSMVLFLVSWNHETFDTYMKVEQDPCRCGLNMQSCPCHRIPLKFPSPSLGSGRMSAWSSRMKNSTSVGPFLHHANTFSVYYQNTFVEEKKKSIKVFSHKGKRKAKLEFYMSSIIHSIYVFCCSFISCLYSMLVVDLVKLPRA